MNWKEFFKPTFIRIILFLILIFILPVFIEVGCKDYVDKAGECTPYFVTIYYFTIFQERTSEQMIRQHFFPSIIVDIILSYLLACTITYLYDKLRKNSSPISTS